MIRAKWLSTKVIGSVMSHKMSVGQMIFDEKKWSHIYNFLLYLICLVYSFSRTGKPTIFKLISFFSLSHFTLEQGILKGEVTLYH
jgi:hypothetical protein